MPGAGGVILGNFLNKAAAEWTDAGHAGALRLPLEQRVVPQKVVSYDLTKFSYVGARSAPACCG